MGEEIFTYWVVTTVASMMLLWSLTRRLTNRPIDRGCATFILSTASGWALWPMFAWWARQHWKKKHARTH